MSWGLMRVSSGFGSVGSNAEGSLECVRLQQHAARPEFTRVVEVSIKHEE